jgi:hypothetical protein
MSEKQSFALTRSGASVHELLGIRTTMCGRGVVQVVQENDPFSVAEDWGWYGPETFGAYKERGGGCSKCGRTLRSRQRQQP